MLPESVASSSHESTGFARLEASCLSLSQTSLPLSVLLRYTLQDDLGPTLKVIPKY